MKPKKKNQAKYEKLIYFWDFFFINFLSNPKIYPPIFKNYAFSLRVKFTSLLI